MTRNPQKYRNDFSLIYHVGNQSFHHQKGPGKRPIFDEIFTKSTGKPPTGLSRDRYGKPGGPFYEFAEAALGSLGLHATQGLESDVRIVLARFEKLDP